REIGVDMIGDHLWGNGGVVLFFSDLLPPKMSCNFCLIWALDAILQEDGFGIFIRHSELSRHDRRPIVSVSIWYTLLPETMGQTHCTLVAILIIPYKAFRPSLWVAESITKRIEGWLI